jgi:hypothetical protein
LKLKSIKEDSHKMEEILQSLEIFKVAELIIRERGIRLSIIVIKIKVENLFLKIQDSKLSKKIFYPLKD